ncbi:MAG: DUF4065 domain-containing protein [Polyangiaceae bacterium]|nr:DUF4065 domain-containing protein [Polyangiaceae bacterium]
MQHVAVEGDMDAKEKQERLIEAVVALLDAAPGKRLQVTNLNKALFYLDLVALRDRGSAVTDAVYLAYERGPVAESYKSKLEQLTNLGIIIQDEEGMAKPIVLKKALPSFRYLDDSHRQMATNVATHIGKQSASDVSGWSHKNPGWIAARKRGEQEPINMLLAMQQIMEHDPWLDEPVTEQEQLRLDEKEETVPW